MLELHSGQQKVLNDPSHKKLVIVGRGWGKTTLAIELAIKHCRETPSKVVRLYVHSFMYKPIVEKMIIDRLVEKNIFLKIFREQIVLSNTSRIIVDILRWPNEDVIFDDALDTIQDLTIMFTPIGWSLHRGPTMQNPLAAVPDEIRSTYSKEFAEAMFDGDLCDEYDRFKIYYQKEYGMDPPVTRYMFNRICSDPLDLRKAR